MSRRPSFPDFIEEELLRVPMTLNAVIDAVQARWRLRLQRPAPGDGDPARALHQHRAELVTQTLRTLRETAQADLRSYLSNPVGGAVVPGLAKPGQPRPGRSSDLSLIDEDDVAVDIEIVRCTQAIKQAAEAELRDLHTYTSALVHDLNVARDTNPFGPERFVRALWRGVQQLPLSRPLLAAFMHDAAGPLAEALRKAYASASLRLQEQGVVPAAYRTFVFGGGTAWGTDLGRYRPSEDLHLLQDSLSGRPRPPTPAVSAPPPAASPASTRGKPPAQWVELLDRLFGAMQQERGLAAPTQALLARLQPVMLRLVQTDPTPLDAYDHAAWRFMNQLVFDIECGPPAHQPRLLALGGSLVDHLASAEALSQASFTWAIARLAAARQHALEQALMAAAPQVERLQRISLDEASSDSAAVPLDIGSLDTVPAGLMPESERPAAQPGAFTLLQASVPGTQMRCHLQGRWRHLMTLWSDPDSESVLLLEPPSGRLWALRQTALSRLLGERLARPLRLRSLVRRAADRLLRSA